MATLLNLGNLCVLVSAAEARLLDAAALDGHDDHGHGSEDAGHEGAVVQIFHITSRNLDRCLTITAAMLMVQNKN